jgi:hypothetical protein
MNIKFSTYGKPDIIKTKEEAETLLRSMFDDDRVDLLLLNVLSNRPMVVTVKGVTVKIEQVN